LTHNIPPTEKQRTPTQTTPTQTLYNADKNDKQHKRSTTNKESPHLKHNILSHIQKIIPTPIHQIKQRLSTKIQPSETMPSPTMDPDANTMSMRTLPTINSAEAKEHTTPMQNNANNKQRRRERTFKK
jgi:hypothetical protein